MHIQSTVSAEVHAKFTHWCKAQNRSVRGMLRQMVEDAVAQVRLPPAEPKPAYVLPPVDEPERYEFYQRGLKFQIPMGGDQDDYTFAPDSDYRQYRAAGDSPDIARKRVEFSCETYRVDGWTPPPELEPKVEPKVDEEI
jgi:hypothetical protein